MRHVAHCVKKCFCIYLLTNALQLKNMIRYNKLENELVRCYNIAFSYSHSRRILKKSTFVAHFLMDNLVYM